VSATNRSERGGDGYDFFATPAWCVDRIEEAIGPIAGAVLEPSCGDGAIVRAMASRRGSREWTTVDVRPEAEADITADFTWMGCPELGSRRFDWAIGNPPYSHAEAFVRAALARCDVVVMLLRLNWLASEGRADFLREHTPSVYVLPNRPSFTGEGTDATDYAWMAWGLDGPPAVRILASTPAHLRVTRLA